VTWERRRPWGLTQSAPAARCRDGPPEREPPRARFVQWTATHRRRASTRITHATSASSRGVRSPPAPLSLHFSHAQRQRHASNHVNTRLKDVRLLLNAHALTRYASKLGAQRWNSIGTFTTMSYAFCRRKACGAVQRGCDGRHTSALLLSGKLPDDCGTMGCAAMQGCADCMCALNALHDWPCTTRFCVTSTCTSFDLRRTPLQWPRT
jgi:hypothetical protein